MQLLVCVYVLHTSSCASDQERTLMQVWLYVFTCSVVAQLDYFSWVGTCRAEVHNYYVNNSLFSISCNFLHYVPKFMHFFQDSSQIIIK